MKQLTVLDKMFLLSETREVPMHVGGVAQAQVRCAQGKA